MVLEIISAEQRLKEKKGHKIVICGSSGVGKTTLATTLDPQKTLFIDLEAGDTAIKNHPIDVYRPRTWPECVDLACFLGGANPSLQDGDNYSQAHYDFVKQQHGNPDSIISKYDTLFIDSITVAGRLCFTWCTQQPEARSDRSGKLDTRAAYGLHGRQMMAWLSHLQHIREKNVVFVGILDEITDDYNRKIYSLQIEGSKTSRELPGIVDEVLTMAVLSSDAGPYRAFVCQPLNEWGYPAKDRSGMLDTLEEPHLGKLITKMDNSATQQPHEFVDPKTRISTSKGENENDKSK
tara:strand:- start:14081 stop:14959 length:879 start_codon:yes stop_codon:yes gene_type:complete